jgi:hypothetical protein
MLGVGYSTPGGEARDGDGNGPAAATILPLYQTTMKGLAVDAATWRRMPFAMIGVP